MKLLVFIISISYLSAIVKCTSCDDCDGSYRLTIDSASDNATRCSIAKDFITCLETDLAMCTADNLKTYGTTATDKIASLTTDCAVAYPSTCSCEMNAIKADVSTDTAVCSNAQSAIKCLRGTTDGGCTDSRATAATAYEERITNKCTGGATKTCLCEIVHTKANVTTLTEQCTAAKELVTCVRDSEDAGCIDTRVQVGTAAETFIDELGTDCPKMATCACEINHTKAATSSNADKCVAAKIAKECLQDISSTTEVGCDGTSKAADLIIKFAQPLIDDYCGAASLNGVGLTVGILVMLLEMTRWI